MACAIPLELEPEAGAADSSAAGRTCNTCRTSSDCKPGSCCSKTWATARSTICWMSLLSAIRMKPFERPEGYPALITDSILTTDYMELGREHLEYFGTCSPEPRLPESNLTQTPRTALRESRWANRPVTK